LDLSVVRKETDWAKKGQWQLQQDSEAAIV
jgi:hypothetical protein